MDVNMLVSIAVVAIAITLAFTIRPVRMLLVDTFRHPRTPALIIRDEQGQLDLVHPNDGQRVPEHA